MHIAIIWHQQSEDYPIQIPYSCMSTLSMDMWRELHLLVSTNAPVNIYKWNWKYPQYSAA